MICGSPVSRRGRKYPTWPTTAPRGDLRYFGAGKCVICAHYMCHWTRVPVSLASTRPPSCACDASRRRRQCTITFTHLFGQVFCRYCCISYCLHISMNFNPSIYSLRWFLNHILSNINNVKIKKYIFAAFYAVKRYMVGRLLSFEKKCYTYL